MLRSSATFTIIPNCWKEVNKMGKIIFVNDHKFYYEFDVLIPSIMSDKINEIVREMTEGEK